MPAPAPTAAYAAYASASSATASPVEVVRMAYARIITACDRMKLAAETKRGGWVETFNAEAIRAQAILVELTGMLALGHVDADVALLSDRLASIYLYCREQLVLANVAKDPKRLPTVRSAIDGLHSAWEASLCAR
jgi:flagellar biosynthetic protein FliS